MVQNIACILLIENPLLTRNQNLVILSWRFLSKFFDSFQLLIIFIKSPLPPRSLTGFWKHLCTVKTRSGRPINVGAQALFLKIKKFHLFLFKKLDFRRFLKNQGWTENFSYIWNYYGQGNFDNNIFLTNTKWRL